MSTLSFALRASGSNSVIEPSLSPLSSICMGEGSSDPSPSLLSEARHVGMIPGPKNLLKSLNSYRFCRPSLETHSPIVTDPVANGLAYIYIYHQISSNQFKSSTIRSVSHRLSSRSDKELAPRSSLHGSDSHGPPETGHHCRQGETRPISTA